MSNSSENDVDQQEEDDLSLQYNYKEDTNVLAFLKRPGFRDQLKVVLCALVITGLMSMFIVQKILRDQTESYLRDIIEANNSRPPNADNITAFYTDTLKSVCAATKWQKNVYLNCTNVKQMMGWPRYTVNPQGAMNLRNSMLTCLRWAIDAGVGLVMPRIAVRATDDIIWFDHWDNYNFLFDENSLRTVIADECPQLKLYDPYLDVSIKVNSTAGGFTHYSPGKFREHIDSVVKNAPNYTNETSIVIWENEPLFGWNSFLEGKNIHQTLFKAVNFRKDILDLSEKIIDLLPPKFIGFHLRNERDTGAYNYSTQVTPLVKMMKENFTDIKTIYVAIGTIEIEEQFRSDMKDLGLEVISKRSLIDKYNKDDLLKELDNLQFDQSGVIDYHVLIKSHYFFGVGISSFSFGVAFERGKGNFEDCYCRLHGGVLGEFKCCF